MPVEPVKIPLAPDFSYMNRQIHIFELEQSYNISQHIIFIANNHKSAKKSKMHLGLQKLPENHYI